MRGRYFRDISILRVGGENNVPLPKDDEVVVYRSFMKAGLRFHLDKLLVEVLKTFEIYLHQLTPEAIIKVGIFIWAMRSQGLEPNARCFCNILELSYETKATGKEQYHNNFGCYSFVPRSEVSYRVPTFRKKWPGSWMQKWFYVKNDLSAREDVRGIIQCPIWSRFSIRRPAIALGNDIQTCHATFNKVCCEHVKAAAQPGFVFSVEDTKDPSAEASMLGGRFYSDVWMKGGHEMADEAIRKNEKESHDGQESGRS
jgi:hypothetical protein